MFPGLCDIWRNKRPRHKCGLTGSSGESGLLRLFYSELFDASMALQYLFKSRDSGILQFLGNRLFDLSPLELDFFLPQLLVLYLYTEEPTRNAIHPYLVKR